MKGIKSFEHRANRNRTSESDIPAKFRVMEIIKENFGLFPLTDEVLQIPEGGYADFRQPDLLIRSTIPAIIIELQGPVHNLDSETVPRRMDLRKDADYVRLGSTKYMVIRIYGGERNDYHDEQRIVSELKSQGLPVNAYQAEKYRERKERCARYSNAG